MIRRHLVLYLTKGSRPEREREKERKRERERERERSLIFDPLTPCDLLD